MLRLVQAAQCCTEREYVDYNPPQKAHRSTDWERMGGYTADAKSKNYLEDEDEKGSAEPINRIWKV